MTCSTRAQRYHLMLVLVGDIISKGTFFALQLHREAATSHYGSTAAVILLLRGKYVRGCLGDKI